MTKICVDFTRRRGFFFKPKRFFASEWLWFGYVYLAAMIARAIFLWDHPIPIVFHWVLAAFVITVGLSHRAQARAMNEAEPMTITDYLLGAVGGLGFAAALQEHETLTAILGPRLCRACDRGASSAAPGTASCRATCCGRPPSLRSASRASAWSPARPSRPLRDDATALLIARGRSSCWLYSGWMLFHDEFIFVVLDTGIALLVVAALHLWQWNGPMLAGVAASVVAGLVQASGFKLHEHFNHNDLYHVIQIARVFLLYRGARRLTRAAPTASTAGASTAATSADQNTIFGSGARPRRCSTTWPSAAPHTATGTAATAATSGTKMKPKAAARALV